ncbi:DUF4040 domain-containing protein [Myxococcota bacterium]|nr:DUF4040 domain-containing protein [Myxococcota bacterium]MBU1535836.1 DUF4040 domain-containing protein [Myxococcota bacterium]
MLLALLAILIVVMLAAAVLALEHGKLLIGVIAAGLVSLIASVIYVILAAPDVAMTEAAIGSGLSTIMFLYVISRLKGDTHG